LLLHSEHVPDEGEEDANDIIFDRTKSEHVPTMWTHGEGGHARRRRVAKTAGPTLLKRRMPWPCDEEEAAKAPRSEISTISTISFSIITVGCEGTDTTANCECTEAVESRLTEAVPELLEAMNQASTEVNVCERAAGAAQLRYARRLRHWERLRRDLKKLHGGQAFTAAWGHHHAAKAMQATSSWLQEKAREFHDAGASGAGGAEARRDQCEKEFAGALQEFKRAQDVLASSRAKLGDNALGKALTSIRVLDAHQAKLSQERRHIDTWTERAKSAKGTYMATMRELERISEAVHTARRAA
jgi:hypothetical protein